jgi:hypothetical protein
MMKQITDMDRGAEQPSNEHQKVIRDGAVHDTQGEVTRKPGFQKGHAKAGGRKKGSQNKITRDVKEAILAAGEKHGSDGKGKDGLVGCFMHVIRKKPEAWCSVAGKCLPNDHRVLRTETDISYETLEEIEAEMKSLGMVLLR